MCSVHIRTTYLIMQKLIMILPKKLPHISMREILPIYWVFPKYR